jgi:hypothetical protein
VIVLVSGATLTVTRLADSGIVGRLFTPADRQAARDCLPWAADNGAFSGFDEKAFLKMLLRLKGMNGCRFVACPDVVGNWQATSDLFSHWHGTIAGAGFPVAYVAQDGLLPQFVPWSQCDALFIGGTTDFKLSDDAGDLAAEAKRRGKWLHMGRVNTLRRIKRAHAWGVDSIDGTRFSRFPDTALALALRWIKAETRQGILP